MYILLTELFNQCSSFCHYSYPSVGEWTFERSYYGILVRRIKIKLFIHVTEACLEHHQTSACDGMFLL